MFVFPVTLAGSNSRGLGGELFEVECGKTGEEEQKIVVIEMTAMIQAGVGCSARWSIESMIQVTSRKRRWVSRSGVDGYDTSGFV